MLKGILVGSQPAPAEEVEGGLHDLGPCDPRELEVEGRGSGREN